MDDGDQPQTRVARVAYLGRELARAEHALTSGGLYVRDAAPEVANVRNCSCSEPYD